MSELDEIFGKPKEEAEAEEKPIPELGLFDIIRDISENRGGEVKKFLKNENRLPSQYSAYMIARAFGNFFDTVLYANEWNRYYLMPDEAQLIYFSGAVKPKKRFTQWHKPKKDEIIQHLAQLFGYSEREMRLNLANVSHETIQEVMKAVDMEAKNTKTRKKK